MAIKLGSTGIGSLYLGSTKISEAYLGSHKVYSAAAPTTPDNVLVFKFSDSTYNPSSLTTLTGATWTQLSSSPNVWKWDASSVASTNWASAFRERFTDESNLVDIISAGELTTPTSLGSSKSPYPGMFKGNTALRNICKLSFPNATAAQQIFGGCINITLAGLSVPKATTLQAAFKAGNDYHGYLVLTGPIETTSALESTQQMFFNQLLTECPDFETSGVINMESMFRYCESLKSVRLYHTDSVQNASTMFSGCNLVETGALALYQQMSTQTNPPAQHTDCFTNCGSGTVTGAAELAQIPASWGGTGA